MKQTKDSLTLTVKNIPGEIVGTTEAKHSDPLRQERLRQSRIKFNLSCILITISATFCFITGGLFLSGKISEDTALKSTNLIARVLISYSIRLMESAQNQLQPSQTEPQDLEQQ